jgi:hypothetical protein
MLGNSRVGAQLMASQEQLSSMQLVYRKQWKSCNNTFLKKPSETLFNYLSLSMISPTCHIDSQTGGLFHSSCKEE